MEILGHSQISLTMNTYGHVLPGATEAAATSLDSLLGGGNQERKKTEHPRLLAVTLAVNRKSPSDEGLFSL
jgi:hypothetical protein